MDLDRTCACGCRTPIVDGMYVYQIGSSYYAQKCVRWIFMSSMMEKSSWYLRAPEVTESPVE